MRPYSQDIRLRVVRAFQNQEGSQRQIARRYSVSLSFVRDLLRRYRQTGSVAPKAYRGRPTSKLDQDSVRLIRHLVDHDPTTPLSSLCERLAQERQISISRATVWRALHKTRAREGRGSS